MRIISSILALVLLVTPSYAQVAAPASTQATPAQVSNALTLGVTVNTLSGKAPGISGKYAVVDSNGNVVNMVQWDGVTDYIMPCQPCTFVPFEKLSGKQGSQWSVRAADPTIPATGAQINCVGAPTANFTVANGKVVRC